MKLVIGSYWMGCPGRGNKRRKDALLPTCPRQIFAKGKKKRIRGVRLLPLKLLPRFLKNGSLLLWILLHEETPTLTCFHF